MIQARAALTLTLAVAACAAEPAPAVAPVAARPGGPAFWGGEGRGGPGGAPGPTLGGELSPPLPDFVRTDDSDEWVARTFVLQASYRRALLVGGPARATVAVPAPSLARSARGAGGSPPLVEVPVAATYGTIGEALADAKGGDLVAVSPGRYQGFVVGHDPSMKDGAYVVVKALGQPGEVVIDRPPTADPSWMIFVEGGHHLVIDGFAIRGTADGKGPRAGIMLDGNFRDTSTLAHHVAVRNVWSDGHREWGIHAVDSRTVLVEDSVFSRSQEEHGVYVSDGSDDWVLRRNVFFANVAGGLQINVDPLASFEETMEHPALAGHPRWENSRRWAEGLLRRGNELFGEHGWPDGRGVNFLVEDNVMNENGRIGGAALNLAAVSDSLFQNNLVYGNRAGAIALWDNANPFDDDAVQNWPKTPEEARGDRIPLFGCKNVRVRNNTVVMDGRRAALQCRNGSTGCVLTGNLAVNVTGPSLEVFGNSLPGLDVRGNVLGRFEYAESTPALLGLAKTLPEARSKTRVEAAAALAELEAANAVPWLRLDGRWPAPSPGRPDFHPKRGSSLLTAGDPSAQPPRDAEGRSRAGTSFVGAFLPR